MGEHQNLPLLQLRAQPKCNGASPVHVFVFFGGGGGRWRGGRALVDREGSRDMDVIFSFLGSFVKFGWNSYLCILYVRVCISYVFMYVVLTSGRPLAAVDSTQAATTPRRKRSTHLIFSQRLPRKYVYFLHWSRQPEW